MAAPSAKFDLTDLSKPVSIHLIGIAGSGMSGLALLLLGMGHKVSGCDRVTTTETERMQGLGMKFNSPQTADPIADADIVVYSSAIPPENPAFAAAVDQGKQLIRRAECLAAILHTKAGVIISGTHGKTTTSSMAAHLLRECNLKPSYYVGAEIPILGANAKWEPEGEMMIAEGDESDGTLALYKPTHAVMLNIEAEHLDFYRDLDHVKDIFTKLADQTTGHLIYCAEDDVATEICRPRAGSISYGWETAGRETGYSAANVRELRGSTAFTVMHKGEPLGDVELGIPGQHNVLNALAAITIAHSYGADFSFIARALSSFAGAKRRFETKYLSKKFRFIDDYGHHPTELEATLQTALSLKPERLVVLFQPHRFSRTQLLADDFGKALQAADRVFITDVYPASEKPIPGITGQTIVDAMKRHGDTPTEFLSDFKTAHYAVGNALQEGDLLITLGAGDVHEIGTKIATALQTLEEIVPDGGEETISYKLYEPMRKHTTMLVGGPAQFWCEPHTFSAFADLVNSCRDRSIPIRVIGRGSNILVKDGGIRGAVIHPTGGEFSDLSISSAGQIIAGAGVRFKKLASFAKSEGVPGFEWMEGIPGNVGGSLRMNAGAMGLETFDHIVNITFLDEDGEIRTRSREEIVATYRNVQELRRNFALKAVFKGIENLPGDIESRWNDSREKRKKSQPIAASAGCSFKNPESIPAGQLIDTLGLKGQTIGSAAVSEVHGNFIVNQGNAKAADILALIASIQKKALSEKGITLETEVKILGEDEITF